MLQIYYKRVAEALRSTINNLMSFFVRWHQMPKPTAPNRQELLDAMDQAERQVREIATRWPTQIDGLTRWLLLLAANRLLRVLARAGRR